jgi:hypothetical protein
MRHFAFGRLFWPCFLAVLQPSEAPNRVRRAAPAIYANGPGIMSSAAGMLAGGRRNGHLREIG